MKKKLLAAAAAVTGLTLAVAPTVDARPTAPNSIVDVAVATNAALAVEGDGPFDTLIAAVSCDSQKGVLDTLAQRGQYTVFAPLDSAFDKLGLNAGNVCGVPGEALTDILTYHVAKGRRDSSQVLESDTIRMLNGDRVTVNADELKINDSSLVLPFIDVPATNGIIHVIDTVLIPPAG